MEIRPVGYRCLIKHEKDAVTKAGLVIPENVNEKGALGKGEIVAVGNSKRLQVGDKVYFKKYAIDEVEVDGVVYSIIENKHVLAKIEDGDK
jgi:co-chaperonin GroES (HSP10)